MSSESAGSHPNSKSFVDGDVVDRSFGILVERYVSEWHDVKAPTGLAQQAADGLRCVITDFESLRGQLEVMDEPASFEDALVYAAAMRVDEQV
ncbi:hypothetical protein [Caballeronia sp. LZ001]|uniref:hypothetical protein n=1 Tax=Caballeronia sp. LZ001 TaxID=3038553 RepID=UPI0028542660|nr:hypothetical protein [Caballeronia sp. LZ001]MDR5804767.1 hypothetical protein [Caballeronia sp. LZ001]